MRSTFRVLFYTKNQAIKNGRVPVMGRITVNGTTASFSCKRDVPLALWDVKGNCAKGKSEEARRLNRELENIKAQIGKHYQYLSDHDSFLTAKKVYDRYNGFGEEIHSLMEIFNIQIRDYKRQIGKTKAQSTYRVSIESVAGLIHGTFSTSARVTLYPDTYAAIICLRSFSDKCFINSTTDFPPRLNPARINGRAWL